MPQENNPNLIIIMLACIVAAIILFLLLIKLINYLNDFAKELKYLNCEIGRTTGDRRLHFIHQKRRLWLSLIPFVKY